MLSTLLHIAWEIELSQPARDILTCHFIRGSTSNLLSLCVHFYQQAFNAASVVNHMKKLQLLQSEPSETCSTPHIIVQTSEDDHETLGTCRDEADTLDPNGNPVHAASHISCSNPESGLGVFPQLKASHSEPGNVLTSDETKGINNYHSEIDAPFRPSKRWGLLHCSGR